MDIVVLQVPMFGLAGGCVCRSDLDLEFRPPDPPRSDEILAGILKGCMDRGANLLLDVPPSEDGVIPDEYVQALMRLRHNVKL